MTQIYPQAYFGDAIVPIEKAQLSVATSAVLYGLSVYTVIPLNPVAKNEKNGEKNLAAFCLARHFERLINSAKIIGIDTFEPQWSFERFEQAIRDVVKANAASAPEILTQNSFLRITVHVSDLVPGTKSRGLATTVSMFIYEATPIIPQNGARIKTSIWRRVSDTSIPSRAKVNGAYVNSVLGKQDALDSGYDDCLFLDEAGHVCELSAANIFMVRDGALITPGQSSDILEGINRRVVLDVARGMNIPVVERTIDLTELYVADEIFACGTSASIAPITEIDAREMGKVGGAKSVAKGGADGNDAKSGAGQVTKKIQEKYAQILRGEDPDFADLVTFIS